MFILGVIGMAKKIYVSGGESIMHEFTSEEGEGNFVASWGMEDVSGMYDSFESLLENFSRVFGLPETGDYYYFTQQDDYFSTLTCSYLADEDGNVIDGDVGDAYIVDVTFLVSIIEERSMTDEDAKEFGIPLY